MIRPLIACLLLLATPAVAQMVDPWAAATLEPRFGDRVPPGASFRDADGRAIRFGELLDGRPMILAPVYYRCPNICGLTLAGTFEALRGTGMTAGRDFRLVAFSIDPREGPAAADEALRRHAERYPGLVEGARFLTGDEPTVRAVTDALGFGYAWDEAAGQFAHAAAVAVLTPDGRIARYVRGFDADPIDLRLALIESSTGRLGTFVERIRMLCFGYDPATGRYTTSVVTALRVMGVGTALTLALVIGGWWWRERRGEARAVTR